MYQWPHGKALRPLNLFFLNCVLLQHTFPRPAAQDAVKEQVIPVAIVTQTFVMLIHCHLSVVRTTKNNVKVGNCIIKSK